MATKVQEQLGSDIAMAFDECIPYPWIMIMRNALRRMPRVRRIVARGLVKLMTAKACLVSFKVACTKDLRKQSAEELVAMDFEGYSIGSFIRWEPS